MPSFGDFNNMLGQKFQNHNKEQNSPKFAQENANDYPVKQNSLQSEPIPFTK